MTRPNQQSITLNAAPPELFSTFLESRKHAAVTGAPARVGKKPGAPFKAFGGQPSGRNLLGRAR